MTDAEMTEWCEQEALAFDEQADAHRRNATEGGISRAAQRMQGDRAWDCDMRAASYRIAAAALRWYTLTEKGGDDHAARQAIIAACKEATR